MLRYSVVLNFTLLVSEVSHFSVSAVLLKHFPFFSSLLLTYLIFLIHKAVYAEIFLIITEVSNDYAACLHFCFPHSPKNVNFTFLMTISKSMPCICRFVNVFLMPYSSHCFPFIYFCTV